MSSREPGLVFRIHGMDCADEIGLLKGEVGPRAGGAENLSFDLINGKMTILRPSLAEPPEAIAQAVARTGMQAEVWDSRATETPATNLWQRRGRAVLTATSGLLTAAGFVLHASLTGSIAAALGVEGSDHQLSLAVKLLYGLGALTGGWFVFPKAWLALRRLRPDMNLLMTIAVLGAVIIGEWFEASTVAFLFGLSLVLEAWSVARARRAVEALLKLAPDTVRLPAPEGSETQVPAESVPVGTVFLVKPGDRVPLDGDVVRGASEVNQAPITGESVPVAKSPGTPVFAGTINGSGALEVKSTKLAGETTLAHIIRMVGEAQSRRAPSEQWVEKFARYYTPIVMAVALATLVIPPVLLGQPWPRWIYSSLVFLVIGCPCALVISTPVSIVAALAAAARQGILIKGGVHVEAPARLRAIAFDKTGTLTEGHPSVADVISLNGGTEAQVLRIASSIESQSDHPLARAIISYARERGVTPAAAVNFRSLEGRGAVATVEGLEYWLGSHRYLEERGMETPEDHSRIEMLSAAGKSVVTVGDERRPLGLITLADAVRPHVPRTIRQLREQGIERTIMLTGDNRPTAEAIGRATGVDEICSELLPEDKVAAVERLVNQYRVVAMVGDGINDAPAMGRATLGIAMGAAGSDAAIEAADIALMSDDLSKLPWLVSHSRRTLGIIRQNVGLSLAVKAVFVALTLLGHASLWAAITADMGVSLLVIFNALRLLGSGRAPELGYPER